MRESSDGWIQIQRRKTYGKEFEINGKDVTFYFQNFPSDWDETSLWQTFKRYGTVVDVYIAKKLNKHKLRFGFARFLRIQDIPSFEKRLNRICIGTQKIIVNLARFDRKEQVNTRNKMQDPCSRPENPRVNPQKRYKSFVDVVRGTEDEPTEKRIIDPSRSHLFNKGIPFLLRMVPLTLEMVIRMWQGLLNNQCLQALKVNQ